VQVVHASADAPAVNVLINGATPDGLAGVPFAAASPYLELPPGPIDAAVNAVLPDGTEAEVLTVPNLELESAVAYTVIAAGSTAALLGATDANELGLFILSRPVLEDVEGVRIQVLHGSPAAPEVDVYVTAPDASLAGATAATFGFGEVLDLGIVPAAEYRIRIALAGTDTIVFDSGAVALPQGADLSVIAVDSTGPASEGSSPVDLLVVFADGSVVTVKDGGAAAPAGLTAVHNAFDTPEVCVVAAGGQFDRVELVTGMGFGQFRYVGAIPPASYSITLEVVGSPGCSGLAVVTFEDEVSLETGVEATAMVAGSIAAGLEFLVLPDDLRPVATEARVRIVHGSAATPPVDLYVVPAGTDITDPAVAPAFSSVEFLGSTGFAALLPGEYDVFVTLAGDTTPAISLEGVVLEGGNVITAIARDPADTGAEPGLIIIDHVALKDSVL
jgi:hypothetical protein